MFWPEITVNGGTRTVPKVMTYLFPTLASPSKTMESNWTGTRRNGTFHPHPSLPPRKGEMKNVHFMDTFRGFLKNNLERYDNIGWIMSRWYGRSRRLGPRGMVIIWLINLIIKKIIIYRLWSTLILSQEYQHTTFYRTPERYTQCRNSKMVLNYRWRSPIRKRRLPQLRK